MSINQEFKNIRIGLALSGGGYRAALFHLGVLSYFSKNKLLENVTHLSTVSGGSILMGLIYSLNEYKWPSSKEYDDHILPLAKKALMDTALLEENTLLTSLIGIFTNGDYSSHSDVVARLKQIWNLDINIQDLDDNPIWTINTTTGETGKSWRIEKSKMGDYKLGYIKKPDINLADAIAASSGFPVGIGPLVLNLENYNFTSKDNITRKKISLCDGGLYDNLGTEVFFKRDFSELAKTIDFIVISDASKPFETQNDMYNMKRKDKISQIMDISTEQIRSLRVRFIHKFLRESNYEKGMHIRLGDSFLGLKKEAESAKSIETDLKPLSEELCDDLIANGFSVTAKNFKKIIN